MSGIAVPDETFASGRYYKRKRTQINYHLAELDATDSASDFESSPSKKRKAKPTPKAPSKRQVFPFLSLPAEIRNMIYTHALTDPLGMHFVATFKHKRRNVERVSARCQEDMAVTPTWSTRRLSRRRRARYEQPESLVSSLLATNKQIHEEGLAVLYGNELVFADSFALYSFIINLGPIGAQRLKVVRLLAWGYGRAMKGYNHSCFAVLAWASNITAFHIDSAMGSYGDGAEQLYRDAFPWLEAVGAAKGKPDAAIDVLRFSEACFDVYRGRARLVLSLEQRTTEFKAELRKLLVAQQQRVMAKPVKKQKSTGRKAVTHGV